MRIFLTGGTGFIGGHLLRVLSDRGHEITCLVRPGSAVRIDRLALSGVKTVEGEFTRPEAWVRHVADHDAVINTVGIIRETRHAGFDAVHAEAPIALFNAARDAQVKIIVQVSALGADGDLQTAYFASKRRADEHLQRLGVPFVILRPSLVYGPGDHSMTMFTMFAAAPITPVPGDGEFRVQPIYVDDLVRAVIVAVEEDQPCHATVNAGGKCDLTFNDLLDILARRLGKKRALKFHVPMFVMKIGAAVTDMLGGRGPITSDELGMLKHGNYCDNQPFIDHFGFEPLAFEAGIARKPPSEADRWHARLAPLRVPLRLTVAFIWLATGIISAFFSVREGYDLLQQVGITGAFATVCLYGTSFLEIFIGAATAIGWRVRLMGAIQILLMFGFTIILSIGMPELWLHPFGPLTKNIPILGATLAMMALED